MAFQVSIIKLLFQNILVPLPDYCQAATVAALIQDTTPLTHRVGKYWQEKVKKKKMGGRKSESRDLLPTTDGQPDAAQLISIE